MSCVVAHAAINAPTCNLQHALILCNTFFAFYLLFYTHLTRTKAHRHQPM